MSEYLYKSQSNKKSLHNTMIKDIESWQDDVLFSKLEEYFSKTTKIEDLNKIESEKEEMKSKITSIQMKIDNLKRSQLEKEEKIESTRFDLEEEKGLKLVLENRLNEVRKEIKEKHERKANLENPLFVSQLFIEKLDANGLNYLFMQLYNKVQQQQYYLQAQSYNLLMSNYGYMNSSVNNANSLSSIYNDGGNN